jgi:hypothetical protein
MCAAAIRRPHDDQCSAPPRTMPATGGAVPCLGCSPTGCVPKHVFCLSPAHHLQAGLHGSTAMAEKEWNRACPPPDAPAANLLIRDKALADRGEHRQAPGAVAARLIWRSNRKLSPLL